MHKPAPKPVLMPYCAKRAWPKMLNSQDPVALLQALIACESVTPAEGGAIRLLQSILTPLGFDCQPMLIEGIHNLYATRGKNAPHLCFAGHTDVVPVGALEQWQHAPFAGTIAAGKIYGRGAVDMKGAIACFIAAMAQQPPDYKVSLLITGDEEGEAEHGTKAMLPLLAASGEKWDGCLVGEPTNPSFMGEVIKVGRRGSMKAEIVLFGQQGHAAYPERADNPLPDLGRLAQLLSRPIDAGAPLFQPSTITVTNIEVGNPTNNIIPASGRLRCDIRFNTNWTGATLTAYLHALCAALGRRYELHTSISGEAFFCGDSTMAQGVAACVASVVGKAPTANTGGGTSDARFIKDYCPVVEFGLVGASMHKVDEHAELAHLEQLTKIYAEVLRRFPSF